MTTLEKIENIDKLMEQYQVGDVYSLIEKLEENKKPEDYEEIASENDFLKGLYAKLKITKFLSNIDFDTIQTRLENDIQANKPRVVISFYLDVLN